jgi:hypothetical protein
MGTHLELTASNDHKFDAYRADPAGTLKGGVVVIQEIFGVNHHIRSVVDRFAALGYVAIAPALFDRIEAGFESGYSPEEVQSARRFIANSRRLEGNTYSLLDTTRLIELGEAAEGRDRLEAQMIDNHKEAIEFLVNDAAEIGFNRYTILNLHDILAQNLLPDANAPGRLRRMAGGIEKSTYHPLEMPQLIEECFNQLLDTGAAIRDPFEQALFAMVQLPYLQPFDDVNKRVSRLSANIPFIKRNLSPLSFIDVPRALYMEALLGVYELNKIDLLRDVFIWAYERSAARYAAVRQSLGEPDPFRFRHRAALRQIVGEVVRAKMDKKAAAAFITAWVEKNGVPETEREKFRDMAESELVSLHEGNFARYQIRPSEFAAWQEVWGERQKL